MSDMLSFDDYTALAKQIELPDACHIDGGYHRCSGPVLPVLNPASAEVLCNINMASDDDVNLAVTKAREVFDNGDWSRAHPADRKAVLIRLAKLMKRNRHELAVIESLDSGKPIADCAEIDIPESINTLIWHAEAIDKIYDDVAPSGEGALAVIVREPVGVVGCVLPWNFPLLMLAWKIGPALAAGNSVIIKPAEQTPLSALYLARLAVEAGLPRGVLQVLIGDGPGTGQGLGCHDDVDMISFTGSTETGRLFLGYAAQSNLKKVTLECGGKNPAIVMDDAEDLESVAAHIVTGAFWNLGQNCSAVSRLIVHEGVKEALVEKLKAHIRDWRQGEPLNPSNKLGVPVDAAHGAKIQGYLDEAKNQKVAVLAGALDSPSFPVIIDVPNLSSSLAVEEIFGPVLVVHTVKSMDEAVQVANDTPYGLTASVFCSNIKRAVRAARALKAGTVTVNSYGEGDISTPFGGYKQSGFGGRDNGLAAHDQFTETKTIWLDLADTAPDQV